VSGLLKGVSDKLGTLKIEIETVSNSSAEMNCKKSFSEMFKDNIKHNSLPILNKKVILCVNDGLSFEYFLVMIISLFFYLLITFNLLSLFFAGYDKKSFLFVLKNSVILLVNLIMNAMNKLLPQQDTNFIISAVEVLTPYILGLYIITFIALIIEFIFKKLKLL